MIRDVVAADAAAIAALYAPYVTDGVVTFEEVPPDAAEMAGRIAQVTADYPWTVWEADGRILGYAYANRFHVRAAYRWAVETTVYLDAASQGRGIGTALYGDLIARLTRQGFVAAIGVVTLPNPASAALHEKLGFVLDGVRRGVGYKAGGWHDVGYWQRDLAPRTLNPDRPAVPVRA